MLQHYDRFLEALKATITTFYGADPRSSPDLGRIVSVEHTKRIAVGRHCIILYWIALPRPS